MSTLVTRARRHLAAVAALALAGSLASCAALSPGSDSTAAASGALTVSTSFYPIQYLAQAIGGEHVAVTSVTPTNVEPHDFELSPKDVTALSASSLVLYVSGFQPSLDDALTQVSGPTVVDLAGSVDLVHHDGVEEEHEDGATEAAHDHDAAAALDPHFWLDPVRMQAAAKAVEAALAQADPAHADDYAAIYYAGGHATMWDLPHSPALDAIAARIYDNGGVVAAVCHGPAGLLNIRLANGRYLIENKQVAAFTNDEERAVGLYDTVPFLLADALQERGAIHLPAANFQAQTIVSERLVSGQNPASARGVARAMLSLLR